MQNILTTQKNQFCSIWQFTTFPFIIFNFVGFWRASFDYWVEFIYKVPGAAAKFKFDLEMAWPSNGAVWTAPRVAAVYVAASLATGTTAWWA
jgi:hypothetical protein